MSHRGVTVTVTMEVPSHAQATRPLHNLLAPSSAQRCSSRPPEVRFCQSKVRGTSGCVPRTLLESVVLVTSVVAVSQRPSQWRSRATPSRSLPATSSAQKRGSRPPEVRFCQSEVCGSCRCVLRTLPEIVVSVASVVVVSQ